MDELGEVLVSKGKKATKRKPMPAPVLSSAKRVGSRQSKQSVSSVDEGFGSSLDPLNDSIAETVKRRKRNSNLKQFDSKYFLDSVINRMENKYQSKQMADPVIDVQNLEIIGKKSLTERKEFGDFENSLEDLRQKSFRNKGLISNQLMASTPITTAKTKTNKKSVKKVADNRRQTPNSMALQSRDSGIVSIQSKKVLKTNIIFESDDESDDNQIVRHIESDSDEESVVSNKSEELDENHPLMRYENRSLWTDKEYQLMCLKKTIEALKNDNNFRFRNALKDRAKKVFGVPGLPSGPHVVPIVCFNRVGELNFEYYFISENSPINPMERLRIDPEVIYLSRVIYDYISLPTKPRSCQKRLVYTKQQIQYN